MKLNNCKHCNVEPYTDFSWGQRTIFCCSAKCYRENDLEYVEDKDVECSEELKALMIGMWNTLNPEQENE